MPGSPIQLTPRAKYPNARNTAIAPRSAPMSGRVSTRASGPTRTRRSSGRAVGAAVSAMSVLLRRGGQPARPAPSPVRLAGALGGERGDLRRVRLVDDSGAGEDRRTVSDGVEVRHVEDGEHDRQIALQILLLVDREQHLAGLDLLDRAADVERLRLRPGRQHVEARDGDVGVEGEEAVALLVGLERG